MTKYGLNLKASQQKKPSGRPPLPPPLGFFDDEDDDIEKEISRHASKNMALMKIEEQHKAALEEDPSVFDYDGVYDEMKEQSARPVAHQEERKSRYTPAMLDSAKERKLRDEIIYERNIAKERSKDDHLYADKPQFVTGAFKKEKAKRERMRQLQEEKDDVTKKEGLPDFYLNLPKNVAYGCEDAKKGVSNQKRKEATINPSEEQIQSIDAPLEEAKVVSERQQGKASISRPPEEKIEASRNSTTVQDTRTQAVKVQPSAEQPKGDHHKRNEDTLAAATERFFARKKAKHL